ncbi:MAG: MBL fold metallo-hydrolase, partial [Candidatus Dormibacteraeota bacterium]|nr:MBL fold metallo-hydrolase [Candidatus Dormibacteraeota bacterium]
MASAESLRFCRVTNGVSNFYAVEQGGKVTLVDAGTPRDWTRLVSALETTGLGLDAVDCILLTHAHSDHTGFSERARTEAGVAIWLHAADEEMARGGPAQSHEGSFRPHLLSWEAYHTAIGLGINRGSRIVPIAESRRFDDGETVDVPGRPRIVHVPGHTDGSCAVLFERPGWLATGDALVTLDPLSGERGPRLMPRALTHNTAQALESLPQLSATHARTVL